MSSRALPVRGAVALVVGLVALSGCALRPGVAVEVGDRTVTTSAVDDFSEDLCEFQQLQAPDTPIPQSSIRQTAAVLLANREITDLAIEELDVRPGEQTSAARTTLEQTAGSVPAGLRDFYADVVVDQGRGADVIEQLGEEDYASFVEGLDVEVDPRYGIAFEAGQPVPATDDGSSPVSEVATTALLPEPDPAYLGSLPSSQICGG